MSTFPFAVFAAYGTMRHGMTKQRPISLHLLFIVGSFVAVLLCTATAAHAQDKPKITEPTLKPSGTAPPMPPAANVAPSPPAPSPVETNTTTNTAPSDDKATYTFKFEPQNSVSIVLDFYSQLTGRNVIQHPAIASVGNISIDVMKTPVTKADAILAIESVLYAYGVSLTPMGEKFVKAVPNANIASEGVGLAPPDTKMPEGDRVTAQVLPLHYLDVSDGTIVASLQQFIHPQGGKLVPLSRSNSILVIDTALTIRRLQEILERLDQPVENRVQTYFFTLKNAEVAKVTATLQALITGSQPAAGARPVTPTPRPPGTAAGPTEESIVVGKVTIQSDERTNTLIILSRPSNYDFLRELIDALDAKTDPEVKFKAFKLQHAKADAVAELILQLTGSGSQPTITRRAPTSSSTRNNRIGSGRTYGGRDRESGQPTTVAPTPTLPPIAVRTTPGATPGATATSGVSTPAYVLSERARIIPDSRQGSILVLGTATDVELVERIIPEIDLVLTQVMIESVIVEVKLDNTTEFGVNLLQRQWNRNGVQGAGASLPATVTSNALQKLLLFNDPSKLAAASASGGLTYFLTFNGLDLDAIIKASAGSSNFKVLQKPLLQSSQDEPAHIFVGESRPIVTSTQQGFTSDTTVRSQIEQLDIGVSLDITPNITPAGLVELQVEQIVEDVSGQILIDGNLQPIVSRRELKSLVSVQDQGVVALGGILKNSKTKSESKVPVLGDLPLLGFLFKSTSWIEDRIELVVFLRPTVMRSATEAQTQAQKLRTKFKGLNNIPKEDVPPLPQDPEPEQKKPWYTPFQPPKEGK